MALTREQTVELARSQKGTREDPPGSNRVIYSLWYGFVAAWCAMFVSWVMAKAGIGWYRFASTATSVAAARRAGRLVPVSAALPGDVMVHLYEGGTLGHTGIATTPGGTQTVEGNTDGGGSRTGGQVLEHARPAGYWQYCIRLDYPQTPAPQPAPQPVVSQSFPEDDLVRHDHTSPLDAQGNGYIHIPYRKDTIVSVVPNGADPEAARSYGPIPRFAPLAWGNETRLVITGGQPGGGIAFSVWTAGS